MSNNKYIGGNYPSGGGAQSGPYVTFMNSSNGYADGANIIQIHRGQTLGKNHSFSYVETHLKIISHFLLMNQVFLVHFCF